MKDRWGKLRKTVAPHVNLPMFTPKGKAWSPEQEIKLMQVDFCSAGALSIALAPAQY